MSLEIFFTDQQIFMSHNTPEPPRDQAHSRFLGRKYEDTPIGALLSVSILPRKEIGPYHYFSDPTMLTKQEMELVDNSVWQVRHLLIESSKEIVLKMIVLTPFDKMKPNYSQFIHFNLRN